MMQAIYLNSNLIFSTILTLLLCVCLLPLSAGLLYKPSELEDKTKFWFIRHKFYSLFLQHFYRIALFYFLFSSLNVFFNPNTRYEGLAFQLDQTSSQAFISLFLISLGLFNLHKKWWKYAFIGIGTLESIFILVRPLGGFLQAPSFDSAFVAAIFPILPWQIMPLALLAIIWAKGTTAFTILAAQLIAYIFIKRDYKAMLAAGLVACLFPIAYFTQGASILDSNGRIAAWRRFFAWWNTQDVAWFGTGNGTFAWLGPCIDNTVNGKCSIIHSGAFVQMHNDWLQILFETGFVGLFLAVILYLITLHQSRTSPKLFTTWAGFAAFAMTYHPLRFMITGLFMAYIWREVNALARRRSIDEKAK